MGVDVYYFTKYRWVDNGLVEPVDPERTEQSGKGISMVSDVLEEHGIDIFEFIEYSHGNIDHPGNVMQEKYLLSHKSLLPMLKGSVITYAMNM